MTSQLGTGKSLTFFLQCIDVVGCVILLVIHFFRFEIISKKLAFHLKVIHDTLLGSFETFQD